MKSLRFVLSIVIVSLCIAAFAQTHAQKPVAQTDAQKSFDTLKSLAGSWEGHVTIVPPQPEMGGSGPMKISIRTTSRGNALMHEMSQSGSPDNPITMLYLDGDRLLLTHYCDAGNRPRMTGKLSPDGKKVEFDFLDIAGNMQDEHMQHAVFTMIDANHHSEDWTFMMKDKPMQAHFDLQRAK
jgi:hypothetical protein